MLSRRLDSLALRGARVMASYAPRLAARGLERPCFLVGCGRSGSSLLRRLLSRHPRLAVLPSEVNELWHPRLYPWTAGDRSVPPLWLDPERFTRESLARSSEADHQRRRATFGAYQRLRGGSCLVNKTEMIHFMLPRVGSWYPEARFVHLVRDGRAVALSRARRLQSRAHEAPDLPNLRSFDELLDESARFWRSSILAVEEAEPGLEEAGRYLEVRYEDLCGDPPSVLQRIARFFGVDPAPFEGMDPAECQSRNHKFRQALEPPTVRRLTELMQPQLGLLGYLEDPPDDGA